MATNITSRLGQIVLYTLSEDDVRSIIQARRNAGYAARQGNDPHEGDTYPALIVRDWADPLIESGERVIERYVGEGQPNRVLSAFDAVADITVNLQVFLDGNDVYWATSRALYRPERHEGDAKGKWDYRP